MHFFATRLAHFKIRFKSREFEPNTEIKVQILKQTFL